MPNETLNILIGAGIALVSAIITGIVSYLLQWRTEQKKRAWAIEDEKREKKYMIEKERLGQAEMWANNYMQLFNEIKNGSIVNFDNQAVFSDWFRGKILSSQMYSYQKAIFYRIGDDDLAHLAIEMSTLGNKMVEFIQIGSEKNDELNFTTSLNDIFEEMTIVHGKFINRIDDLKANIDI